MFSSFARMKFCFIASCIGIHVRSMLDIIVGKLSLGSAHNSNDYHHFVFNSLVQIQCFFFFGANQMQSTEMNVKTWATQYWIELYTWKMNAYHSHVHSNEPCMWWGFGWALVVASHVMAQSQQRQYISHFRERPKMCYFQAKMEQFVLIKTIETLSK